MKIIFLMLLLLEVSFVVGFHPISGVAGGGNPAQSVADIARQERERKKQLQSKTVYTNAEKTVSIPAGTTVAATAATAGVAQTPAGPAGPTDNKGRDEKYWRGEFKKARDEAKRADDKVTLLEQKVKDLNLQLLRQSDMYNRENRLGAEIQAANKDLEAGRNEAAQARQKIKDLEEELRRSNGLPGWAR